MHDVNEDVAAAGLRLLALLVEQGIIKHKVRCFVAQAAGNSTHSPMELLMPLLVELQHRCK